MFCLEEERGLVLEVEVSLRQGAESWDEEGDKKGDSYEKGRKMGCVRVNIGLGNNCTSQRWGGEIKT